MTRAPGAASGPESAPSAGAVGPTVVVARALALAGVAWAVLSGLGGAERLWVDGLGAPPSRIW
ncbi:MAG: hypothetical protein KDK70_10645, partial [Myxococcales bacterium]|nr:hypothetical protein [Myxococcales bacterium]